MSADRRVVTDFVVAARCAPKAALPPIPVRRDGAFQFVGWLPGGPRTRVTIRGRFVGAAIAKVRLHFVAAGCDSGIVAMTLRLS